ncbi:MAG: transcriptional regulator, HxlR family [Ilumatobacteraceae bacterium]|nr:transcriptional regulator, HxlR family [Ilumatobacteraceae bacterium]
MTDPLLQEAVEIAGDRWVLLALGALVDGPRRFGDLVTDLGGIAPNILIDRLRRMERHGLIGASLYSQRPRRFVYDLTESGRELAALLPALTTWAARRTGGEPHRHRACGSAVEVRLWCPTCATTVDGGEVTRPDATSDVAPEPLRWL